MLQGNVLITRRKSNNNPTILLTFGDHALQPDYVGVVKLAHDRRLAQEVPPLSLHISAFQRLYRHGDLFLPRRSQSAAADLAKLT